MPAQQTKEFKDFGGYVSFQVLSEDRSGGSMTVRGTFQRCNTKNANGRIYSDKLWERILSDPNIVQKLNKRMMTGVAEHPESGVTKLPAISHVITGLERKGDEIIGEAEILGTPNGLILQELIRKKIPVGISSRGRGTSQIRGGVEWVDESNFQLDTFDAVCSPSTPGAYLDLVEESLKGPYKPKSAMTEKITELKRIEVRAQDILNGCGNASPELLKTYFKESLELEASTETLGLQLNESDDGKQHSVYADAVATKVAAAKAEVVSKLDDFHASNSSDLDRRIDNTLDGIVAPTESSDEKPDNKANMNTPQSEALVAQLRGLLVETREERDYLKSRLAETLDILDSSEDRMTQRYLAARRLGEELLAKLKESRDELANISESHQALEERYEAATKLVAGVAERQDRARLIRGVREAIEECPELAKFEKSLRACNSMEELEQRIKETKEALDLPQDREDAMASQVIVNAAEGSTEGTEEQPQGEVAASQGQVAGDKSRLPSKGESINESADAGVLAGTKHMLNENLADRGARAAMKAVNKKPGWK